MINCPSCGHDGSKIVGGEKDLSVRMRRRACNKCGMKFRTYEVAESDWKLTVKIVALFKRYNNWPRGSL